MDDKRNENSGALWPNDRKTAENQPDYTGRGEYDGVTFRIAAWMNSGPKGKYLALKFNTPNAGAGAKIAPKPRRLVDEDIPF